MMTIAQVRKGWIFYFRRRRNYINRTRKMASFELSKEMEKDVFLSCHKTKKKCESQ